jgi:hypothetical protein
VSFVDKFLAGEVKETDIDDYISEWHESTSSLTLHEYLGMTWEEYGRWLEGLDNDLEILRRGRHDP